MRFEHTTLVVIGTDCTGSCKSNYHTITTTTATEQDKYCKYILLYNNGDCTAHYYDTRYFNIIQYYNSIILYYHDTVIIYAWCKYMYFLCNNKTSIINNTISNNWWISIFYPCTMYRVSLLHIWLDFSVLLMVLGSVAMVNNIQHTTR